MQTCISSQYKDTTLGKHADAILRKCVHCGLCNSVCPTYQLLGDELDGPRGRIYYIKQMLEGEAANQKIRLHLDRCLTCRSCETTCPSEVEYGHLLEIGRQLLDQQKIRSLKQWVLRYLVSAIISNARLFSFFLASGRFVRLFLPAFVRQKIPEEPAKYARISIKRRHQRKMILLSGCVQNTLSPQTNHSAKRVFDSMGISMLEEPKRICCGAVSLHTTTVEQGRCKARQLIDTWWPLQHETEAFVTTASGCGATIKDYTYLFEADSDYAEKARQISHKTYDISEIFDEFLPRIDTTIGQGRSVVFHNPCTLQHGQKIIGRVERILTRSGYKVLPVTDGHLCCGSAGTYAIFQSKISNQLKNSKLENLQKNNPNIICTANIGCQMHLSTGQSRQVKHWIELL